MDADIAINVEVTISDELRRLLVGARADVLGLDAMSAPDALPAPEPAPANGWQDLVLRRDGQRPLSFRGVAIASRGCMADISVGHAEQRLSLYLAEDRTLYASLVFEPADMAPAHPAHRCRPVADAEDFARFLREWQPELCFDTAFSQGRKPPTDLTAGCVAVRSAFNSMTAEWLSSGLLPG